MNLEKSLEFERVKMVTQRHSWHLMGHGRTEAKITYMKNIKGFNFVKKVEIT